MSKEENYNLKLEVIKAIDADNIKTPAGIPIKVYIQEAENMHQWCQADKDALVAIRIDWNLVDDIPVRCGALSVAEAIWMKERFGQEEAQRKWNQDYPAAYKLRDNLLHHLRFAYRKDDELYGKVKIFAEGSGHADMIQDLINLSILGKANPEPLAKINFDMSLLDKAAQMSSELAPLWGKAIGDRNEYSETKKIRDQAYTHLKEAVDELRIYGQYLFFDTEERLKGYRSSFLRRARNANNQEKTEKSGTKASEVTTKATEEKTTTSEAKKT